MNHPARACVANYELSFREVSRYLNGSKGLSIDSTFVLYSIDGPSTLPYNGEGNRSTNIPRMCFGLSGGD